MSDWDLAVSTFGGACAAKLAGPGDREAAIRSPLEELVRRAGAICGRDAVLHDEVRDVDRRVRPDYGVSIDQVMMGYVEIKAPGRTIDPEQMSGHDLEQWTRQRDLPNLIYTNGIDWRLYRDGEFIDRAVLSHQPLVSLGSELRSDPGFETLLRTFLEWEAAAITSVNSLVRAIAPLTRLLRGEVLDQLEAERKLIEAGAPVEDQPFIGLAADWRRLLFPQADDRTFADGYAQAVTFALLLARTTGIDFASRNLHEVGQDLVAEHSLMGRALQLLTDDVAADFKVVLDLLVRVVGAVRWDRIRKTRRDVYLYLYEEFLAEYDDALRQASGTYYTPRELVTEMVRLSQQVLVKEVGVTEGFASPQVFTIDPAMGTGTYLQSIVETVREQVIDEDGVGAAPGALSELANRLAGFEIQMGPYAVAELRVADLLADAGATLPSTGLKLYVTDTLDDPTADVTQIASGLQTIARSRRLANAIKRSEQVNVVIGNPPYRELAAGQGGWVERGSGATEGNTRPILDDFLDSVPGRIGAKLKNLYVYFWRWSTWKVWESTPADETGVVCLVTTSGYVTGSAFTSMRRYLREQASDGWIIDLTPEGQTPDVPTRIFPGVRQPLAIGIFVRRPNTSPDVPAKLRYVSLHGRRSEKFDTLRALDLDSSAWRPVRSEWTAPFTAAPDSAWDEWPAVVQLMPWYSPGVFPTRTWVYSPSEQTLKERWARLIAASDSDERRALMKDSVDAMSKQFKDLPGHEHESRLPAIGDLTAGSAIEPIVAVGFRAFDRQKLIADPRLIHRAREALWTAAAVPGQVYVVEQHSEALEGGPGLLFSGWLPDFHYFNGRGGRTFPYRHPDATSNFAPGLSDALTGILGLDIEASDVLAYMAAVAAHSGYTETFAAELRTPGIRIPITREASIWQEAVSLGQQVLWVHTFGRAFADGQDRPASIAFSKDDPRRVTCRSAVSELPAGYAYNAATSELEVGGGRFGPVPQAVVDYEVGGKNVLKSWVGYRDKEPAGKRTSALDDINPAAWEHQWTQELNELITLLVRLIELEPTQGELLSRIVGGPLVTADDLAGAGASWPTSDKHRKPRNAHAGLLSGDTQGG